MTKKRVLIVLSGLLILLFILREVGILNVNLYTSAISASQKASMSHSHASSEEEGAFSYHLTVKHGKDTLFEHTLTHDGMPPIEIKVVLDEPEYSGNYVAPLFKNFTMPYHCTFSTPDSKGNHEIDGKIDGEVNARIRGLCSRAKAKQLAFDYAKDQITEYLTKQLNPGA